MAPWRRNIIYITFVTQRRCPACSGKRKEVLGRKEGRIRNKMDFHFPRKRSIAIVERSLWWACLNLLLPCQTASNLKSKLQVSSVKLSLFFTQSFLPGRPLCGYCAELSMRRRQAHKGERQASERKPTRKQIYSQLGTLLCSRRRERLPII